MKKTPAEAGAEGSIKGKLSRNPVCQSLSESASEESTSAFIETLTARARQNAYLFEFGWLDLPEAVDRFQRFAVGSGAVAALGQDFVQEVVAEAFERIPRESYDD